MAETLTNLRTRAQGYADLESDPNIGTTVWTSWVNVAHKTLWRLVVRQNPDNFTTGPTSFTLSGSTDTYALSTLSPVFWKLRALDYSNGGSWERVRRFNFADRNRVRRAYRIMGANLRVIPAGAASGTYRVWYIPEPTALSGDSDQIDAALNMYDEFIVIQAAIRGRKRQRRDFADLQVDLDAIVADIRASADDRDDGEADVVTDLEAGTWPEELPGPV